MKLASLRGALRRADAPRAMVMIGLRDRLEQGPRLMRLFGRTRGRKVGVADRGFPGRWGGGAFLRWVVAGTAGDEDPVDAAAADPAFLTLVDEAELAARRDCRHRG
jgi:hypothetical protein